MRINSWYISSFLISIIVIIPILTIFTSFFRIHLTILKFLKETFFLEYIINSLLLLFGVLFLTFFLGVGSAYLVSFYEFPGSNFFKWALILSFAVPPLYLRLFFICIF